MPIQHAVLALLEEGESYGYELRGQFIESVGPQWGELNIGHLYQVLDRLVRDGLVTKREVTQNDRPDKHVYRLTDAGHQELFRWLEAPYVRQGGYRDDFFLKLFAASRLGATHLATALRVQRQAYLEELASLTELRASHSSEPLIALLIEAALLHTEANLRVVELAEGSPKQLLKAKQQQSRPAGPDTQTTGHGRSVEAK
jgi:DNA-binding PadR family transcriptional regulator